MMRNGKTTVSSAKINWDAIRTVCVVPQTTCPLECPGCYQKEQDFSKESSVDGMWQQALLAIRNNPSITELLVDVNPGDKNTESVLSGISAALSGFDREIKILVTTTAGMAKKLAHIPNVRLSISLHTNGDIDVLENLYEQHRDKIECVSVLWNHKIDMYRIARDIPVYLLIDKTSPDWADYVNTGRSESALEILQSYANDFQRIELDHCMFTVINKQPCPAHTQVNLYPDGSMRQCPYMEREQTFDSGEFQRGCKLIREREERNLASQEGSGTTSPSTEADTRSSADDGTHHQSESEPEVV